LEGGGERIVHRVFGQIEVTEQADKGGKDAAGFFTIHVVDNESHLLGCI
jgi:hypothetical protein